MMKQILFFSLALLLNAVSFAQVGLGTTTPVSSSILDLTSTNKGLLLPRVANTATVASPTNGLMIFDLSSNCLKVYQNGTWSDCLGTSAAAPLSASCTGFTGDYCNSALSGTTYVVTLTNNDFETKQFTPQTTNLSLSGITGLSVSAVSPSVATTINVGASQVVTYTISGTPGATGTLTGTFSKQGLSCSSTVAVVPSRAVTAASATPTVCINTALTAITHTTTGGVTGIGTATGLPTGVTAAWANNIITISGTPTVAGTFNYTIPATGGCGAAINATGTIKVTPDLIVGPASKTNPIIVIHHTISITHTTTNATGIGTATGLPPGLTAVWNSNTITISGTPNLLGTYNYTIPLNGCGPTVNATGKITVTCGAYIAGGVSKVFSCYNLGADTSLDPNTPVEGLHGNYYQWGRSAIVGNTSGKVGTWNGTAAPSGSWSDSSKTVNDPCPTNFRVPTELQWSNVVAINTITRTGSWTNSSTNFETAIHFGPDASNKTLTLPAAGYRNNTTLYSRGNSGYYWSSTEYTTFAYLLSFSSSTATTTFFSRSNGMSVRCVSQY